MANMGDTLRFMVIALGVVTLVLRGRMSLLLPLGSLLTGCVALVSWIVSTNPVVTTLMPVLLSPWLSIHVTLVMTAYALLAFALINSGIGVAVKGYGERMRQLNVVLLYPALWLLGMGIFTGAVWANVSWGRYWAWDPKETWALITLMVYAVGVHRSLRFTHEPRRFHIYIILAFLTVLMTYFGVNHLASLHAYS
jgi:ABC-type transport system involved in cytochrome c biogenesis permease subunit